MSLVLSFRVASILILHLAQMAFKLLPMFVLHMGQWLVSLPPILDNWHSQVVEPGMTQGILNAAEQKEEI